MNDWMSTTAYCILIVKIPEVIIQIITITKIITIIGLI